MARLTAKLNLQPGDKILDISCGWGGLAAAIIKCQPNVHITDITLSEQQLAYVSKYLKTTPSSDSFPLALRDYRQQTGLFDKILSVGMLEHVGPRIFKIYSRKVKDLLNANGIAVIHGIGAHGRARQVNR